MKKKIVYATMIMSTIALLSTGFAAWVISGNDSEAASGSIAVDTVSNASRIIENFTWNSAKVDGEGNPIIVYSVPENLSATTNNWLSNDASENGYENLVISATFNVSNVGDDTLDEIFEPIVFTASDVDTDGLEGTDTNYQTAIDDKYIAPLPKQKIDGESNIVWGEFNTHVYNSDPYLASEYGITVTQDGTDKSLFALTIKFNWGSKFGCQNPYYYYNNMDLTMDNATAADTNLRTLNSLLDGVTFDLTIETKAPTGN